MSRRADGISLRELTDANRAEAERVSVTADQSNYVASVSESLVEAAETPNACPWYRAVYAGDVLVGFIMISDGISVEYPEYLGPYFLWRLLIDVQWQGRGYGRAALDLVVDYLRTERHAPTLLTSVSPGSVGSPMGFYVTYGFAPTGEVFEGEAVLALPLTA